MNNPYTGDRMTILGSDGKPRYELNGLNVRDMRKYCDCAEPAPEVITSSDTDGKETSYEVCSHCGGLLRN